jgi:hypothetical protein
MVLQISNSTKIGHTQTVRKILNLINLKPHMHGFFKILTLNNYVPLFIFPKSPNPELEIKAFNFPNFMPR